MATRMVGGFILVALLFCILLAWPGRRRWPVWLILGLGVSISTALAMSLAVGSQWWAWLRLLALASSAGFCTTAAVRDLRDPFR